MRRLSVIAIAILACERPASVPARWTRPAVVFLGDSLTEGQGVRPEESYPSLLERRMKSAGLDLPVVNAGISGDATDGALSRLERIAASPVSVLFVALGVNDAVRFRRSPEEIRSNLTRIIERGRAARARVVLAGMKLPISFPEEYRRSFENIYPELAKQYGIPLVPFLLEGVAADPALTQGDGLHPNAPGYRRVAEVVWPVIEPVIRSASR
ncbi:MAG TPA: arylesterase [Myxococcales bacterium]|nr:arylesterase [Myxococcales bacterium]